jgi:hypothetical protein
MRPVWRRALSLRRRTPSLTGWPLGLESLGAFDWFAWQIVWVAGLAVGLNESAVRSAFAGPEGRHRVALLAGVAIGTLEGLELAESLRHR